jgi:hypothetical protein
VVNEVKIGSVEALATMDSVLDGAVLLRAGKKRLFRFVVTD